MPAQRQEEIKRVLWRLGPSTFRVLRAQVSGTPAEIQKDLFKLREQGMITARAGVGPVVEWLLVEGR